jgi:OmcA/MtrC family decaheme c-type cytochrome
MCHAFDATDWARRPKSGGGNVDLAATADGIEERSIRFSRMIHMLHTGEALEVAKPYAIYGFGGSLHEFDHVRFPGNRMNCQTCHLADAFTLDVVPQGTPPTIANETPTIRHERSPVHSVGEIADLPITSACNACHNTAEAYAHTQLQTTDDGVEACGVCHSEQRDFAVSRVHGQ